MKNYHFSLEKVLEYRWGLEREAQQELAESERKLFHEQKRLEFLHKEYGKTQLALKDKGEEILNLEELIMLSSYLYYLDRKIEEQEEIVLDSEVKVAQDQEKVKAAMQQRKTLERLKEKDYQDYLAEVNTEEGKKIDEMGLRMFLQQANSS